MKTRTKVALATLGVALISGSVGGALALALALAGSSTEVTTAPAENHHDEGANQASTESERLEPALTAGDVLALLGDLVSDPIYADETTDPNQLLGRPGGYIERVTFVLPGGNSNGDPYSMDRGGAIEVFENAAGAQRRADYITGLYEDNPILGSEYIWVYQNVVIRIDQAVSPSTVSELEQALS